jgi:hypothetical protein
LGLILTQGLHIDPRMDGFIHPEGRRYAYNAAEDDIYVVTEAHITDPGVAKQLESSLAMLRTLAAEENVHLLAMTDPGHGNL